MKNRGFIAELIQTQLLPLYPQEKMHLEMWNNKGIGGRRFAYLFVFLKGILRFESTRPSPMNSNAKNAFDCSGERF